MFAYGYTAGLGLDVIVLPNVFLRAEWEYVQFFPVQDIKIHLNTAASASASSSSRRSEIGFIFRCSAPPTRTKVTPPPNEPLDVGCAFPYLGRRATPPTEGDVFI